MRFTRLIPLSGAIVLSLVSAAPSFAASSTTVAAKVSVTKLAPVTTKASASAGAKTTSKHSATASSKKLKAPVRAGNFCKKTLVGTTSPDATGTPLTCKADAKGVRRWTK